MIHKKEGTLVLFFLCPCRAGKFRSPRRRNHLKKENLKKIRNFEKKHLRDTPGVVYTNYSCANA